MEETKHILIGKLQKEKNRMGAIYGRFKNRGVFSEYGKGSWNGYNDGIQFAIDLLLEES